ncbi:hypothetical protein Afe04nite_79520 [Asanoa ferruginea]|nr:hypothetical protein Afe04nite_79520 [Asanoa ferruginea]
MRDLVEIGVFPGPQLDGLEVAKPLELRLKHAPHGGDNDPDRVVTGVGQPPKDGKPPPDGVGTWRKPLVGQRLPGGVADDLIFGQQAGQRRGEIVGFTAGGGDGKHRPPGTVTLGSDGGNDEGTQGGGRGEIEPVSVGETCAGEVARTGQPRVTQGRGKQTLKHG